MVAEVSNVPKTFHSRVSWSGPRPLVRVLTSCPSLNFLSELRDVSVWRRADCEFLPLYGVEESNLPVTWVHLGPAGTRTRCGCDGGCGPQLSVSHMKYKLLTHWSASENLILWMLFLEHTCYWVLSSRSTKGKSGHRWISTHTLTQSLDEVKKQMMKGWIINTVSHTTQSVSGFFFHFTGKDEPPFIRKCFFWYANTKLGTAWFKELNVNMN